MAQNSDQRKPLHKDLNTSRLHQVVAISRPCGEYAPAAGVAAVSTDGHVAVATAAADAVAEVGVTVVGPCRVGMF